MSVSSFKLVAEKSAGVGAQATAEQSAFCVCGFSSCRVLVRPFCNASEPLNQQSSLEDKGTGCLN